MDRAQANQEEELNRGRRFRNNVRRNKWLLRRLRSWQPIPSPGWVVAIYISVGIAFTLLGVSLHASAQAVVELRQDYTDLTYDEEGSNVGYFDIEVDRHMTPPIWVYYELSGFHQNHRRYVESRDDKQLREPSWRGTEEELVACNPWLKTGDRVNYPCGLVAASVFNDSFALTAKGPAEDAKYERVEVDSAAKTIAWARDTQMFNNLDPEKESSGVQNQHSLNMWLLNRFPPQECYQVNLGPEKPLKPAVVATRTEKDANGKDVEVVDCQGYTGSNPTCKFVRDGQPFTCEGDYEPRRVEDWGLSSGHFLVWMRTAALPTFRKLWARVDREIEAGTKLRVYVQDNFPVKPFYGQKAFLLSTSSILGGRNDFLGIAYIVVGGACLLFAPVFFCFQIAQSRGSGAVAVGPS